MNNTNDVPLFFGNPITMLISNEIDRYNVTLLSNQLIDLMNIVIGSNNIIRIQPELTLLSSLLYYTTIITNKYKLTPGQQLCGLKMIEVDVRKTIAINHTPSTTTTATTNATTTYINQLYTYLTNMISIKQRQRNFIYIKDITITNQIILVLLLSLVPYIHARRNEISFLIEESLSALLYDDNNNNTSNTSSGSNTSSTGSSGSNSNSNTVSSSSDSDSTWDYMIKKLYKVVHALGRTCIAWSSSSVGRFENLCTIIHEINYMMFLFNAEYAEPAYRICRVRMINIDTNRTGRFSKLKGITTTLFLSY